MRGYNVPDGYCLVHIGDGMGNGWMAMKVDGDPRIIKDNDRRATPCSVEDAMEGIFIDIERVEEERY